MKIIIEKEKENRKNIEKYKQERKIMFSFDTKSFYFI